MKADQDVSARRYDLELQDIGRTSRQRRLDSPHQPQLFPEIKPDNLLWYPIFLLVDQDILKLQCRARILFGNHNDIAVVGCVAGLDVDGLDGSANSTAASLVKTIVLSRVGL